MTKICPQCGDSFGPATRGGARRDNPATFRRRITCSRVCAIARSRKTHVSDEEQNRG
jgi:hypothetical protein